MPEKSILDARLAEIDRRLRTIQSNLAPAAQDVQTAAADRDETEPLIVPEAAPVPKRLADAVGPEFAPAPSDHEAQRLVGRLATLVEAQEHMLDSARALVEGLQAGGARAALSVSAGPFAGTDAVRRFEQSLQALPGVSHVALREYEGADRAVIDVHLA